MIRHIFDCLLDPISNAKNINPLLRIRVSASFLIEIKKDALTLNK